MRALLGVMLAVALLLGVCKLRSAAEWGGVIVKLFGLSFNAAKLLVGSASFCVLLLLLLVPAGRLAHKLGQCFLGRLPPKHLADAEPIRFDSPPSDED